MNRRLLVALGASALMIAGTVPAVTAAPPTRQFQRLDISKIDPKLGPALLANKPVTVVVQTKGTPVTARKGLSKAQQGAAAKELRDAQGRLDGGIKQAGGKILDRFQYTYSGIKVNIPGGRIPALSALPGVVAVRPLQKAYIDNAHSVPFIGAPAAWEDLGATGTGETIAVIDTGIDYLHANFGGPGTVAAFKANDPTKIEPGSFPTAKVIGGWDFVGDDYNADGTAAQQVPHPDPDPIDCAGHGSHVAGTAAGDGVLANGSTFTGPYDSTTPSHDFTIGPGVAPDATLIALRIFGCEGSTFETVDALEWVGQYNATHADAIDVVNMSLGSDYGGNDDPAAVATNVLVASGVSVVTSMGNAGPNAYVAGSPGTADGAIAMAAEDTLASFPGAIIDFADSTPDISNANNQNAFPGLPVSGTLKVIGNGTGGLSLGCTAADYGTLPAGTIAVIQRGVCPFVDKGAAAQAAGAIGVIDVNRDDIVNPDELPTFIGLNPELFNIPMIGVGNGVKAALIAADGKAVTLKDNGTIANPGFKALATFSSGGPRNGDSALKPDVTAPGNSIVSTLVGSGDKGTTLSGTSMASPHGAGTAALVREANPTWTPLQVKAAIMNTATVDPAVTRNYNARIWGSGLIQPRKAVDTVGLATTGPMTASLSFGYDPTTSAYSETLPITLWNTSGSDITYNVAGTTFVSVSPATVTVPAHGSAVVNATASLNAAALAAEPTTSVLLGGVAWGGVRARTGVVIATPTTTGAGVYSLRIPYAAVPRALSNVTAGTRSAYTTSNGIARATVPLANNGIIGGYADVYAWGLSDPQDQPSNSEVDIRAVGVQSIPTEALTGTPDPSDRGLIFAINTYGRWSSAAAQEFDVAIYGANKHKPTAFIVGADFGNVTAGVNDGRVASFIFDAAGNLIDLWVADGPANGSTILLPALASEIGQVTDNARFSYSVTGFGRDGSVDGTGQAEFGIKFPAVSTGQFIPVAAGGSAVLPVAVDKGKNAVAPAKGWMVVTLDDANGASQADLVPIGNP